MAHKIVLASKSASRRALLEGAGLPFEAVGSEVDEAKIKDRELALGKSPADIAEILARAKAGAIAQDGQYTIGGDQVLEFDGRLYDKPVDMAEAKARLMEMSGTSHFLRSGLVLFKDGDEIWSHRETSTLWLRSLTEAEIDDYLGFVGERVLRTVGAYELEGPASRLFDRIEGDYFSILGLPLLPLLAAFRDEGALPW